MVARRSDMGDCLVGTFSSMVKNEACHVLCLAGSPFEVASFQGQCRFPLVPCTSPMEV